jgi:hypothetical protein
MDKQIKTWAEMIVKVWAKKYNTIENRLSGIFSEQQHKMFIASEVLAWVHTVESINKDSNKITVSDVVKIHRLAVEMCGFEW